MNAQIYLISSSGERRDVDPASGVEGLKIDYRGQGSLIEIHEGARFRNSRLIVGHQSTVRIGDGGTQGTFDGVVMWLGGAGAKNVSLTIGNSFSMFSGGQILLRDESDLEVVIGDDVMVSTNVLIQASDGHIIRDGGGKIVNAAPRPSIVIGDHVWIGRNVILNKGVRLPAGAIVGSGSVVTKSFETENAAIAGNPARVVREGLHWERTHNV